MRSQRTLLGTAALLSMLGCQVSARLATAAGGEEGARVPTGQLERLAQRDEKSPSGPEPDPGGLPGFRPNAPSPPAARPAMPDTRGGPAMRSRGVGPADSTTGTSPGGESKGEPKKGSEPK